MTRSLSFLVWLALVSLTSLGCDESKPERPVEIPAPAVAPAPPKQPERLWFEGRWQGSTRLSQTAGALELDRAERNQTEAPLASGAAIELVLDVQVEGVTVSGEGKWGGKVLDVSGMRDEDRLRVTFRSGGSSAGVSGAGVSGTWVGKSEGNVPPYSGHVSASVTETEGSHVQTKSFEGKLTLEKSE